VGEVQTAARTVGLEAVTFEIRRAEDIAPAFEALKSRTDAPGSRCGRTWGPSPVRHFPPMASRPRLSQMTEPSAFGMWRRGCSSQPMRVIRRRFMPWQPVATAEWPPRHRPTAQHVCGPCSGTLKERIAEVGSVVTKVHPLTKTECEQHGVLAVELAALAATAIHNELPFNPR
jgi:hypothetical protein